ncbi:MAG: hypothetical protein ABJP33_05825 [Pseudoruegeria sp.]
MATKAELEAELKALKEELALARQSKDSTTATPEDSPPDGVAETLVADAESLMAEFTREIEDIGANKPVLMVLGAFCLGMLMGRGR